VDGEGGGGGEVADMAPQSESRKYRRRSSLQVRKHFRKKRPGALCFAKLRKVGLGSEFSSMRPLRPCAHSALMFPSFFPRLEGPSHRPESVIGGRHPSLEFWKSRCVTISLRTRCGQISTMNPANRNYLYPRVWRILFALTPGRSPAISGAQPPR
jgi:hypothetical protein